MLQAIVGALQALPVLRTLLVDLIRLLKHYEANKRYTAKMVMVDDAISDVQRRLRDSQEEPRRDAD